MDLCSIYGGFVAVSTNHMIKISNFRSISLSRANFWSNPAVCTTKIFALTELDVVQEMWVLSSKFK